MRGFFFALGLEVKYMDKKSTAAFTRTRDAEATEELVGVLTAISVVSKRLAKKLTLLEQMSVGNGGISADGNKRATAVHAD
jgi:hypothetical protein